MFWGAYVDRVRVAFELAIAPDTSLHPLSKTIGIPQIATIVGRRSSNESNLLGIASSASSASASRAVAKFRSHSEAPTGESCRATCPQPQYRFTFRSRLVTTVRLQPDLDDREFQCMHSHGPWRSRTLSIVLARHTSLQSPPKTNSILNRYCGWTLLRDARSWRQTQRAPDPQRQLKIQLNFDAEWL